MRTRLFLRWRSADPTLHADQCSKSHAFAGGWQGGSGEQTPGAHPAQLRAFKPILSVSVDAQQAADPHRSGVRSWLVDHLIAPRLGFSPIDASSAIGDVSLFGNPRLERARGRSIGLTEPEFQHTAEG
jgi:hypothetical protein